MYYYYTLADTRALPQNLCYSSSVKCIHAATDYSTIDNCSNGNDEDG